MMYTRIRGSRGFRSWMANAAVLALGYAFLHLLFSALVTVPDIGSANVPKKSLEEPFRVYQMNGLSASADAEKNKEKVLILTPVSRFYQAYWDNVVALTYPHSLIELGFIVPNDIHGDEALSQLNAAVKSYQTTAKDEDRFARITILRQDTSSPSVHTENERHAMSFQKERRAAMSLARNSLLFTTIQADTSWVFWLDSDVVETPNRIIQDMTAHNKDVLVANCWQRYDENGEQKRRPYDFNSWVDSPAAQEIAQNMHPDEILLEGYNEMPTYRLLLAHLFEENGDLHSEVELDGVGATALLVKADVHRDGAMFPPFVFYHLIESEGFAKMVKRLNYGVHGLPNYLVYHYNE